MPRVEGGASLGHLMFPQRPKHGVVVSPSHNI